MNKIILERFKDDYLRNLSIMAHLRECLQRFDKYMLCEEKDEIQLSYEYNKELMDLLILLEIHKMTFDNYELYDRRINRFIEKIRGDDK